MNRRIVLSTLLLAIIAVALVVSCSGNIDVPAAKTEELSYVTFGNGHSRELSTSYETESYDLLYWFYTATKKDSYGTTGQVGLDNNGKPTAAVSKNEENPAQGLSGRVGPFSQGDWEFTLYAYGYTKTGEGENANYSPTDNLVYKSSPVQVNLKGGEVKNVPVSVSLQGETGCVRLNNVTFSWKDNKGGTEAPTGKLVFKGSDSSHDFTISSPFAKERNGNFVLTGPIPYTETTLNIPADFYTVTATVYLHQKDNNGNVIIDNEGTPLFEQTFGLRVYGNATTVISGDITETVDTYVTFDVPDQAIRVFTVNTNEGQSTNVEVAVTALNGNKESAGSIAEDEKTTVSFPSGALDSTAVHQLDVTVTPTASAEEKFQISGSNNGQTAVAGIDLTMVKVTTSETGVMSQTPVTSFNEKAVTITTYIEKGLSDVSVHYTPQAGDPEAIKTNYTIGTEEQFNDSRVDGYYVSKTGKLTFNTNHFSQYVVVSKSVAYDTSLNRGYGSVKDAFEKAVDGSNIVLQVINENKELIVNEQIVSRKNITLDMNGVKIKNTSDIWNEDEGAWSAISVQGGSLTIIGNGTIEAKENDNYALDVRNGARLIIENGTFVGNVDCVYCFEGDLLIKGGSFDIRQQDNNKPYGFVINCYDSSYKNGKATVTITGGRFHNYNPSCSDSENPKANFCPEGFGAVLDGEWYGVINPEAKIGNTYYRSLKDAVDAVNENETITIVNDVEHAPGISINKNVDFTIDFGGHAYTLDNPGAGSSGTETNGFQLLKGDVEHTITFKNGTINVSENNTSIKRIIQCYSKLNLVDMTIDGTNQFTGPSMVMSFNHGAVNITGNTNIIAAENKRAFDADGNWDGYNRCPVTIDTTGTIVGNIEVGQGYLTVLNADVKGGIVLCTSCGESETKSQIDRISVKGGNFKEDPSAYIDVGYYVINNSDGTYSVRKQANWIDSAKNITEVNGVFTISTSAELAGFAKMVKEGNSFRGKTVKLSADIDLDGKIWDPVGQTGAIQFTGTFDGDNHTIKNLTVINSDETANCASGLFGWLNSATVKNLKIDTATVSGYHNVGVIAGYMETSGCTIEKCSVSNATVSCTSVNSDANGDKCGGIVGHAGNAGVSVKDCIVSNSSISAGRDAGQVVGAAKEANVTGCSATNVKVTANGTSTSENIRNEVIGRVL